jgi:xanthine/CO dehydrogenase XdhC/CoxF family maturation factor
LGLVASPGRRQARGRRQGCDGRLGVGRLRRRRVVEEALSVIGDGKPRLLDFGVTDDQAWEVGLACGGKIQIFVERVE